MKLYLLQALWNPPYEDGSVQEIVGIYSSYENAKRQWDLCIYDDECIDSVRFSAAKRNIQEFTLDEVLYT